MKKWSWGFAILKVIVGIWHTLFYKKVVVLNVDKIPHDSAIVFAPNHQNALMDALAVIFTNKRQPVFLARADIFKNPVVAKILNFLRIMPVYRIRDGKEELAKNDEIFNKSMEFLEAGGALAIFPEASHAGFRHLRGLKKGIPRIVFQAEERNDFKLGLKIVPVGIYYSSYPTMKSTLIVNYGDPFDVTPFIDLYKENEPKGMSALRDEMAKRISPLMIDIPEMDHYDFYEQATELFDHIVLNHLKLNTSAANKLQADQYTIKLLHRFQHNKPEEFNWLKEKVETYFKGIKLFALDDSVLDTPPKLTFQFLSIFIFYLFTIPFHVYGLILNYLPYTFVQRFVKAKIKDVQFQSSFNFGLGLFVYSIWFFLITSIASIWFDSTLTYWLVFFSLPVMGLFTLNNWIRFKKTMQELKYARIAKSGDSNFTELVIVRKQLLKKMRVLLTLP
ncbi:MAG: 1-acyl-sn-glycerol-3-phosphate acyltransferase [Bacteroidales bacterium]|nr:1-acyl-sn-glycerol-3-phosphate acyltransferase [Bacteroidales bacterium]MCF8455988.1 1-acyl-sn-glycerol-3-phosphate acyltransferase [Bacteroidales bacterium]